VQAKVNATRVSASQQDAFRHGKHTRFKFFMIAKYCVNEVSQLFQVVDNYLLCQQLWGLRCALWLLWNNTSWRGSPIRQPGSMKIIG
jgi:hypothetical protein